MEDRIYDIVRKAIEAKQIRKDVMAGYGVDRHSHSSRNDRPYDYVDAHTRYWITSGPINTLPNSNEPDIILYRNAPIATRIQEHHVGDEFDMIIRGMGNDAGCLFHHHLHLLHHLDLDSNYIEYPGDVKFPFSSLEQYLEHLKGVAHELDDKEERRRQIEEDKKRAQSDAEREALERELAKIAEEENQLKEYREEINNLTRYIHNQVQLRFRPIIDPIQSRIKTSHAYDGVSVVIDGGPGTGKTTTMISRLKYLTDLFAIEQDAEQEPEDRKYNLNPSKIRTLKELTEKDKDWMFFSPSSLLKQYLAHAMENETLTRPSSKVFYWSERLDKLMQEYDFFDPSKDNPPFVNAKSAQQNEQLIANSGDAITQLENFFISTFKNKRINLPSLENLKTDVAEWKQLAISIRNDMDGIERMALNDLISLFVQLSHRAEECKPYLDERANRLERVSANIAAKVRLNNEARQALLEIILKNDEQESEDIEDIVVDIDDEQEAEEPDTFTENEKLTRYVRKWVEPYARSVHNKYKLSPTQQAVAEIIAPLLSEGDTNALERIASLYIFNQYAANTRGAARILFASIPAKYKAFRKAILRDQSNGWNLDLLRVLVESRNNTRLHKQEQALLIGFVNTLAIKILRKSSSAQHKYIDCYQAFCRPIIGIDEATDFSIVDIYAMCSFAHKDFSSITLSGDLMQRLTKTGLRSWDDLRFVLPKYEVTPLQKSYRQSVRMLDVARNLYRDTIGETPIYEAYMLEQNVPEAIAYISNDLHDKIDWLEDRIKEIYRAYGNSLPSIAIFLSDEQRVYNFTQLLKGTDFFEDNGIKVIDGSQGETLGTSEQVRVFPIDKVKGMEFDVVFFIDIDDKLWDIDLLKRYMYVGVSRAAFFLGVTLTHDDPEITQYFHVGSNWQAITQQNA